MSKRLRITAWGECPHCLKKIPKKFMDYHVRVCRVRRGLDPEPVKGETINEVLEKAINERRDRIKPYITGD